MVSERYNFGDWKLAGDSVSPENTEVTDLNAFFGGFGTGNSALDP